MRQVFKLFSILSCFLISLFSHSNTAFLVSAEEEKDEKMDTSSPKEEKKGACQQTHIHTLCNESKFHCTLFKMSVNVCLRWRRAK